MTSRGSRYPRRRRARDDVVRLLRADCRWGDEPISKYTRAKVFREAGKRTDVAVRFSTVAGGRDSSEAIRDPRGFAVKFSTEDGNWDLVGNNLGVFFIREAPEAPLRARRAGGGWRAGPAA